MALELVANSAARVTSETLQEVDRVRVLYHEPLMRGVLEPVKGSNVSKNWCNPRDSEENEHGIYRPNSTTYSEHKCLTLLEHLQRHTKAE